MRIGYLILAHQHPQLVARLIRLLDAADGLIAVHFDRNAGDGPLLQLKSHLGPLAHRVLWVERVAVAWGAWSIAEATLNGLEAFARSGQSVDYVHLMSGADYPIRPLDDFARQLARAPQTEYIEAVDIRRQTWVRIGPEHERYLYRHHFNWRNRAWLSQWSWRLQRLLRLKRRFPKGLSPHLGSQWWTLTWPTCQRLIEAGRDAKLRAFFKTVAIPDEMFFQSIVAGHVPRHRIAASGLTFSQFTDYGVPVVYYDDHADYLARQPFYFARKISPHASDLRNALDAAVRGERPLPALSAARIGVRGNEYESVRLARRLPQPGTRIIGHVANPELGDLGNARAFVALIGASEAELALVQQLVAASGAVVCHGNLFGAEGIDFLGGLERYAGYRSDDTALRDHCSSTFLADVLRKSGRVPSGLVLPWRREGGMTARLAGVPAMRPLIVKGNVLRAFLEHRAVETPVASTIADGEFAGFVRDWTAFHDGLAKPAADAPPLEISLMAPDWLERLNRWLAKISLESRGDRVATVTAELAAAAAARLADPAAAILNAEALVRDHLPATLSVQHLVAMRKRAPVSAAPSCVRAGDRDDDAAPDARIEIFRPLVAAAE